MNLEEVASAFAFTLTLASVPPTPRCWKQLRELWFANLRHDGITTVFWLTEWQRRGVPHLHGIALVSDQSSPDSLTRRWLAAAAKYGAKAHCQQVRALYDDCGWYEYLAKHSARGVANYQRSAAHMPAEWKGKTGRMWGHRGDWPTRDAVSISIDDKSQYAVRRVLRSRAISRARARRDWSSLKFARRMLAHPDPVVSRVRGVSQFVPIDVQLRIVENLRRAGGRVSC